MSKKKSNTRNSKKSEKQIENQIKRYLERLEAMGIAWHMKVHGSMFQKAGVPDIIAVINGRFVGIEVKRPGGVVSKLQEYHIRKINEAGGAAFVAYSVEEVKDKLRQFNVI